MAKANLTAFKANGRIQFTYEPAIPKVPEFGIYVLGQPDEISIDMLEEIITCVTSMRDELEEDMRKEEMEK